MLINKIINYFKSKIGNYKEKDKINIIWQIYSLY